MKPKLSVKKGAKEETIADVMAAASAPVTPPGGFENIPLKDLFPSPTNPRKLFKEEPLRELAANIKKHGLIQPATVRPVQKKGKELQYEIVAGERRYRACVLAGLEKMFCRVTNYTDAEVLEIQIAENLHRENVTAMEEADGFYNLTHMKKNSLTVAEIAVRIGKSERYIYERISLRDLIQEAQDLIDADVLPLKHGLFLGRFPDDVQRRTIKEIVKKDWQNNILAIAPLDAAKKFVTSIMLDLTKVKWDPKEANMCGNLPSCTQCTVRTGHNLVLFGDIAKEDFCLNSECFEMKKTEMLIREQKQLKENSETDVVFITTDWRFNPGKNSPLYESFDQDDNDDEEDQDPEEKEANDKYDPTKAVYTSGDYLNIEAARQRFKNRLGEETEFPESLIKKAIMVDSKEPGVVTEVVIQDELRDYMNVADAIKRKEKPDPDEDDEDYEEEDDDHQNGGPKLTWKERENLTDKIVLNIIKNKSMLSSIPPVEWLKKDIKSTFENVYERNKYHVLDYYGIDYIVGEDEDDLIEKFCNYLPALEGTELLELSWFLNILSGIESNYSDSKELHDALGLELPAEKIAPADDSTPEPIF